MARGVGATTSGSFVGSSSASTAVALNTPSTFRRYIGASVVSVSRSNCSNAALHRGTLPKQDNSRGISDGHIDVFSGQDRRNSYHRSLLGVGTGGSSDGRLHRRGQLEFDGASSRSAILGPGTGLADVANWADEVRATTRPETANWHFIDIPARSPVSQNDEWRFCTVLRRRSDQDGRHDSVW